MSLPFSVACRLLLRTSLYASGLTGGGSSSRVVRYSAPTICGAGRSLAGACPPVGGRTSQRLVLPRLHWVDAVPPPLRCTHARVLATCGRAAAARKRCAARQSDDAVHALLATGLLGGTGQAALQAGVRPPALWPFWLSGVPLCHALPFGTGAGGRMRTLWRRLLLAAPWRVYSPAFLLRVRGARRGRGAALSRGTRTERQRARRVSLPYKTRDDIYFCMPSPAADHLLHASACGGASWAAPSTFSGRTT